MFSSQRGIVVVATVAFGLGIDSPAVRVNVHWAGRSGRDGHLAICLFFNALDLQPVRRAIERSSASLRDVRAVTGVLSRALYQDPVAFVDAAEFTRRGVPEGTTGNILAVLAGADWFSALQAEHSQCNLLRGPRWETPIPTDLSGDCAFLLHVVLAPLFADGRTFARCKMSDMALSSHFAPRSIAASRTVVLSMEELARRGIVRSPIEWRGHVFPVAGVREWQATERELEHVASTLATQAHDALEAIERVVSFMTMGVCLARSLCKLFGTDGESDNIKGLCRCSVCSPVCPSF